MIGAIPTIISFVQMADTVFGSKTAQAVMKTLATESGLTDEQIANLDANYRDYVERIARLKEELSQ